MTHEEHWDFERSGQMNLLFRPSRGAAPFTVRSVTYLFILLVYVK